MPPGKKKPPILAELTEEQLAALPKIDPEKVKAAMEEARKDWDRYRKGPSSPPKEERTGTCVFCGGLVVGRISRKYYGDPMRRIIGPGSRNQMTTVHHGWHCQECGLKYEFPPKPKEDAPQEEEG